MDKSAIKIKNEFTYLEKERGSHAKLQKIPLEQRICQRCTLNYIDDEIHFLISCSSSASERTSLFVETELNNTEFDSLSNDE